MDNAFVIDCVLMLILLVGALIGAARGLFKTLMGFAAVAVALVGAVFVSNMLAGPVANALAPKVEDAVVKQFSEAMDQTHWESKSGAVDPIDALTDVLERYGVAGETANGVFSAFAEGAQSAVSATKERATDEFRGAISAGVSSAVYGTAHTVLLVVSYVVLLVLFRLAVGMVDHVFDLPVLGAANKALGALFGLLEAALLTYIVVYAAAHIGVKAVTGHAGDTRVLAFFLNHSPVDLLAALFRAGGAANV